MYTKGWYGWEKPIFQKLWSMHDSNHFRGELVSEMEGQGSMWIYQWPGQNWHSLLNVEAKYKKVGQSQYIAVPF